MKILINQPQFASNFQAKKWTWFYPKQWAKILMAQPQLADKCKAWYHLKDYIESLLAKHPQLWVYERKISAKKIIENPEVINEVKCIPAISTDDWYKIILLYPQLSPYFNKWERLNEEQWNILLDTHPQFEEKAKEYLAGTFALVLKKPHLITECEFTKDFGFRYWKILLRHNDQLVIEKAKESIDGWVALLQTKPELAEECTYWSKFNESDWKRILLKQSQFADRCPDEIYDTFDEYIWDELDFFHPNVFSKIRFKSTLRKLATFH